MVPHAAEPVDSAGCEPEPSVFPYDQDMSPQPGVVVLAIAISSLLAGCGADGATSEFQGRWVGPGRTAIEVKAHGTAEGNDGCNDVAAEWKATNGSSGMFRVIETSDKGCVGVVGWGEAAAYVLSGDKLIIESIDGTDLTELTHAD